MLACEAYARYLFAECVMMLLIRIGLYKICFVFGMLGRGIVYFMHMAKRNSLALYIYSKIVHSPDVACCGID